MSDYLVNNDGWVTTCDRQSLPYSAESLKEDECIVWEHDIYAKVGVATKKLDFQEIRNRISNVASLLGSVQCFSDVVDVLKWFFNPIASFTIYKRSQRTLKEIAEEYQQLKKGKKFAQDLLITQPFIREGLTMSMKGLELVASHLMQKSNIKNLVVCDSLHTFKEQLKEIVGSLSDERHAFIVPCHQSVVNSDPCAVVEQHMLSVLVEKKNGRMHVCVLEPMVMNRIDEQTVFNLNLNSDGEEQSVFSPDEQVIAFAQSVCPAETTTFYYSLVRRQFGPNGGCSSFALRDGVNFLKNTLFFEEIVLEKRKKGFFEAIVALPPAYMIATQSLQKIKKYIERYPDFAQQKLGKRQSTLKEAVDRRTYKQLTFSLNKKAKFLNKYIDQRTAKYQEYLLNAYKKS